MLFGLDLHSWEQWMLASLGLAALAAVAVVVTTAAVVVLTRAAAEQAKQELQAYKLTVEAQVADAKKEGIEAGKTAGDALVRAAELEREAANARLETERIRLETERIKGVVAWRAIPQANASQLERALAATPGAVNLRYVDGDPEALYLAIQISQILGRANWQIAPGAWKPANAIMFGVFLPDSSGADAIALRNAFISAGIAFSTDPVERAGAGFSIATIPGAPTLMVGSRPPPQLQ